MTANISSLDQLNEFAGVIAKRITPGTVIALQGELGAGKTTFVQMLAKRLGINDTLTSPTFSIMNQYQLESDSLFYHLDLYRLNTVQEVQAIGIEEVLEENQHVVVIEWPEIARELLPNGTIWISFELLPDDSRKISVSSLPLGENVE